MRARLRRAERLIVIGGRAFVIAVPVIIIGGWVTGWL
jgi:hypothetical protein